MLLCCASFGIVTASAKAAPHPTPAYIVATQVNLRSAPNGDIQTQLDLNEKVYPVKSQGDWAYVSVPRLKLTGWVAQRFVDAHKQPTPSPGAPRSVGALVTKPGHDADEQTADDATSANPALSTEIVVVKGRQPFPVETSPVVASLSSPRAAGPSPGLDDQAETGWSDAQPAPSVLAPPPSPVPTTASMPGTNAPAVAAKPSQAQPVKGAVLYPDVATGTAPDLTVTTAGFIPDAQAQAPVAIVPAPAITAGKDPATKLPVMAPPHAPQEQGPPTLLFNGDATTVVTTPMMLEGTFSAVGGRDMGKINGSDVNLRAKPDKSAHSLAKLQPGDKLYLTSQKKDWFEVSVPARQLSGWVHSDFVHEFPRVEITGSQVRLRELPSTEAPIKDELDKGEVFYEYERKDGWVKVASSAAGINGWIKGEYVGKTNRSPSRPYAVRGDQVNFRASPAVDADIIAKLPEGTAADVLGRNDKWSYIKVQGHMGWMYSEFLMPRSRHGVVIPSSPVGQRLIARARLMQGTPYVWGGQSDDGVDCSGLIFKVLLDEGASGKCLPRRASEQMAQLGLAVEKEDLQPGDLVFFTTYKPGPSHVGIYLGDGDFIHASSAQHQVAISNLSEGYYKQRFCGARRITEDELRSLR